MFVLVKCSSNQDIDQISGNKCNWKTCIVEKSGNPETQFLGKIQTNPENIDSVNVSLLNWVL